MEVISHFTTVPIEGMPERFVEALGICIDLEWHMFEPKEVITEVGYTFFKLKLLRDVRHGDIPKPFGVLSQVFIPSSLSH
jgi:hypothetical protein